MCTSNYYGNYHCYLPGLQSSFSSWPMTILRASTSTHGSSPVSFDCFSPYTGNGPVHFKHTYTGCSIRVETLGNFEGKSGLPRQNWGTLEKYRGRKSDLPRQNLESLEKYRGKIENTEAEFKNPRKITEAEFWLMLHPEFIFSDKV